MRILVHDYGGYPFTVQLARALASRGHEVLYLYSTGLITPKGAMHRRENDSLGLAFEAVTLGNGAATRRAGVRRWIEERRYGASLAARISAWKPDVVLSANTPIDAQGKALTATHEVGGRFAFWMQDLYSAAVERLLSRRNRTAGRIAGRRYARIERRLIRASDVVIAAAGPFVATLREWSVPPARIHHIPNWAPMDDSTGIVPRANEWAREHNLDSVPVLAYTGTLGRKHNPHLLVELAAACPDARVLVVAEGVGATWLLAQQSAPSNLRVLPLQPPDRLPEVLATADVLVALLDHDASEFSEPSKVLTYLAAGRPILAAIPNDNQAARTILDAQAGRVVDPSDLSGLREAARNLLADAPYRELAGRRGREYAANRFNIAVIADRFESALAEAEYVGRDPVHRRVTRADV